MYSRLLLLIFFVNTCFAQQPFKLSSPGDLITGGVVIPLNLGGNFLYLNKKPFTEDEIKQFQVSNINGFDRSAVKHNSLASAKASDALLVISIASPAILMLDKKLREDIGIKGVMYFETIGLTAAEIQIVKGLIRRARPYVYNPDVPVSSKMKPDATCSFFSGHTAMAAAACFFAAGIYSGTFTKKGNWPWLAAAVLPISTGYFRYNAGKHFFTDILAGLIVGAANGILITELHKN
jgi:membrane-associated phospholipid phosphatase